MLDFVICFEKKIKEKEESFGDLNIGI